MSSAFDSAVATAENKGIYYGQIHLTADYVVLLKGYGKLSYIEGQHDPKDRRVEIGMVLSPIDEMGITNLIRRSCIDSFTEWTKIVWPSMRDICKVKRPDELDGKYIKVQLVQCGTYPDKKTGEEREKTAMKFLTVYSDESTCKSAFATDGNTPREAQQTMSTAHTQSAADTMAVDMTPAASNTERQTALMFVETLVKQTAGNRDQLAQLISTMPFIAKWFSVDSPEVKQMLAA